MTGRLVQNPAWVTRAISGAYETLEAKVPPAWLPKLSDVSASRGAFIARMPEYGCGAYGCVLPTLDAATVLKVTTDSTEAEFAAELAPGLVAPICVDYHLVVSLSTKHEGRRIYLLWREAADDVGKLAVVLGPKAEALVLAQHRAAQVAYKVIATGGSMAQIRPKISAWLSRCEDMAASDVPELRKLGAGLVQVYEEQRIFFGDLHAGNLGRVFRDDQASWVITDPGHVAVIDPFNNNPTGHHKS